MNITQVIEEAPAPAPALPSFLDSLGIDLPPDDQIITPESMATCQALLRHARPNSTEHLQALFSLLSPGVRVKKNEGDTDIPVARGILVPRTAVKAKTMSLRITFPSDVWGKRHHLLQQLGKRIVQWWLPGDVADVSLQFGSHGQTTEAGMPVTLTVICLDAKHATPIYPPRAVTAASGDLRPRATNIEPLCVSWAMEEESHEKRLVVRALRKSSALRVYVRGIEATCTPRFLIDSKDVVARRCWPLSPFLWELALPAPAVEDMQIRVELRDADKPGFESGALAVNPTIFQIDDPCLLGSSDEITQFTSALELRFIARPAGSVQLPAWARKLPIGQGPFSYLLRSLCPTVKTAVCRYSIQQHHCGQPKRLIDLQIKLSDVVNADEICNAIIGLLNPPLIDVGDLHIQMCSASTGVSAELDRFSSRLYPTKGAGGAFNGGNGGDLINRAALPSRS